MDCPVSGRGGVHHQFGFGHKHAREFGGISTCPPEILQSIFKKLDLQTLKSCRQVCTDWNKLIHGEQFFLNKVCLVHRALGFKPSTQNQMPGTMTASGSVSRSSSTLAINHLRLQQLYCSKYEMSTTLDKLFAWMNTHNLENITHLEIRASQILLTHFLLILKQFPSIAQLSVTQDSLIWNPLSFRHQGSPEIPDWNSNWDWFHAQKLFQQLTKLDISIRRLHEILFLFNDSNLLNAFQSLRELHLQGSLGSEGNLNAANILAHIIRRNHTTLKSLKLDAFPCQVYQWLHTTLRSFDARPRNELFNEFHNFCQMLKNRNEESDEDPISNLDFQCLEELSLNRFPIANMNDELVSQAFVPFLHQLQNLRKFSMSQVYFSSDMCVDQFVGLLPQTCQIKLISLHLHVPIVNLDNILDVLHPNHTILEYEYIAAEIEYENVNWKIIYLTWNSLKHGNAFLQTHLSRLAKLKLYNLAFTIGDEEIQFIISGGGQLVELHFEGCNMNSLTDVGLTGLHNHICERVRIDKGYKIDEERDYNGVPLWSLKNLRSLRLGKVGGFVTDASARIAFNKLPNLRNLVIFQHPQTLTHDVISQITQHRRYYFSYHDFEEP